MKPRARAPVHEARRAVERLARRARRRRRPARSRLHQQRSRTVGAIPLEIPIADTAPPPVYQQIARTAAELRLLGMSNAAIGRRLGVDPKTIEKAIRWLDD